MTTSHTSHPAHPVLVEAWRGEALESAHRGALVISDAEGGILLAMGDAERRVFPRSAIKLLQALPLVTSGAADRFGFDDADLALACASHNGEDAHVRRAASMLAKLHLDQHALECGTHEPRVAATLAALINRGEAPCPLHNNCSGKHSGFLALGAMLAGDAPRRAALRGYVHHDHAVMREVTQAISDASGFDLQQTARGIDGCSIPTYAIPLRSLALAYARVATGAGLTTAQATAARVLRTAATQQPFMTAGSARFDTEVMTLLGERVYCKVGAEAVYCAALPEQGLGVAIKIDDGATPRAAEVVMAAVIEHLVTLSAAEREAMHARSAITLLNWNGAHVGTLGASAALQDALTRTAARH